MITLLESNHEYESSLNTHKTINELISAHKGKLTIKKYSYDLLNEEVNKCDVLINTTTVPGDLTHTKITYEMLNNIKKHGVFIDLGADQGFSCEAIRFPNDKKHPYTMFKNNVSIVLDDIPSMFYAKEASIFTNKFIFDLLGHFKNDSLETIKTDKVINSALQTFGGNITNEVIGSALNLKTKKI
jgi:alanine dehydrogenase